MRRPCHDVIASIEHCAGGPLLRCCIVASFRAFVFDVYDGRFRAIFWMFRSISVVLGLVSKQWDQGWTCHSPFALTPRVPTFVPLQMLVIDEADEMLNKGFKEQIYDIYRYLPPSTQVVLISATMPQEVLDMTKKFMNMPVKILVKRDELTLEGIKQASGSNGSPALADRRIMQARTKQSIASSRCTTMHHDSLSVPDTLYVGDTCIQACRVCYFVCAYCRHRHHTVFMCVRTW